MGDGSIQLTYYCPGANGIIGGIMTGVVGLVVTFSVGIAGPVIFPPAGGIEGIVMLGIIGTMGMMGIVMFGTIGVVGVYGIVMFFEGTYGLMMFSVMFEIGITGIFGITIEGIVILGLIIYGIVTLDSGAVGPAIPKPFKLNPLWKSPGRIPSPNKTATIAANSPSNPNRTHQNGRHLGLFIVGSTSGAGKR